MDLRGQGYPAEKAGGYSQDYVSGPFDSTGQASSQPPPSYSAQNPLRDRVFYFLPSPLNPQILNLHSHVHPDGSIDAPVYCARLSDKEKPHVLIAKGRMSPENVIASANFHNFRGRVDFTYLSQNVPLKSSMAGSTYTIDLPNVGQCKWAVDSKGRASPKLTDSAGRVLAELDGAGADGKVGMGGDTRLKIAASCDDQLFGCILASAFVIRRGVQVTNFSLSVASSQPYTWG